MNRIYFLTFKRQLEQVSVTNHFYQSPLIVLYSWVPMSEAILFLAASVWIVGLAVASCQAFTNWNSSFQLQLLLFRNEQTMITNSFIRNFLSDSVLHPRFSEFNCGDVSDCCLFAGYLVLNTFYTSRRFLCSHCQHSLCLFRVYPVTQLSICHARNRYFLH